MVNPYFQKTHSRALGTWPLKGEDVRKMLRSGLEVGYRAFDTAQMYQNEAELGEVLSASGLDRDAYFITTKVAPDNFSEAKFEASVRESCEKLRVDAVDVLLLHWPPVGGDVVPSLKLLEAAQNAGLTKAVGVSNYTIAMLETAVNTIEVPIVTNQVEFHPLLDQTKLLNGAARLGIPLSSYCSVAKGKIFEQPLLAEIGDTVGKNPAQVCLRWILQKGVSMNAMSTNPVNQAGNFDVMDFTLSSVDMARIDALAAATQYRIVDDGAVPWIPDWD